MLREHIIIPMPENQEQPPQKAGCFVLKPIHALYALPIINAGNDASQIAMGLAASSNALKYSATGLAFSYGVWMHAKFMLKGFNNTITFVKERRLPENWPNISRKKLYIAGSISVGISLYVVISDVAETYFYVQDVPKDFGFEKSISAKGWYVPVGISMASAALATVFGESLETFQAISELLSSGSMQYTNKFSKYAGLGAMYALAPAGAVYDALSGYMGMRAILGNVFGIQTMASAYTLGILSLANGGSDFALNGRFNRDQIDAVVKYYYEHKGFNGNDIFAFLLSAAASGILTYACKLLTDIFIDNLIEEFHLNMPEVTAPIGMAMSLWIAANNIVSYTASFVPMMHSLTTFSGGLFSRAAACVKKPVKQEREFFNAAEYVEEDKKEDEFFDVYSPEDRLNRVSLWSEREKESRNELFALGRAMLKENIAAQSSFSQ